METIPVPLNGSHFLTLVTLLHEQLQGGGVIVCRIADFAIPQIVPDTFHTWEGYDQHWPGTQPPSRRNLRRFLYAVPDRFKQHPESVIAVGPEENGYTAAVLIPPPSPLGEEKS